MRGSLALVATLALGLSGCAALTTGQTNPQDIKTVLDAQNARGCIYLRITNALYFSGNLLLVGTWGNEPPAYADCWKGLPPGTP